MKFCIEMRTHKERERHHRNDTYAEHKRLIQNGIEKELGGMKVP